ncbi:MAG TPA: hypothetical protein VE650_06485 [Acetobacteraceae bacterium]|nr:hypothetical protein [Acetobacteraceae bacterium]
MHRAILAVLLLAAAPSLAPAQNARPDYPAQSSTPPMPNLANPQAQANMGQQHPHARTSPGATDAPSIPTPELGRTSTPTPQR